MSFASVIPVPNILHITDLHLVSEANSPPLESHKIGLVPHADLATQHRLLRHTFESLGERLRHNSESLDAIVVTGDIAEKNNREGYQAFLALIDSLGTSKPSRDRIMVVPGNHDVKAGLRSRDPNR